MSMSSLLEGLSMIEESQGQLEGEGYDRLTDKMET